MTAAAKPGDPRFFSSTGPHALGLVAATAGAKGDYPDRLISAVAPLQIAGPDDVSFLDNRRYASLLAVTKAAAVILHPDFADAVPAGTVPIITPEPYVGWARVAALFHPIPAPVPGIHPTAIIDPAASIGAGTEIGPGCVIGAGAEIGPGCIIGPLTVIGAGVVIGPASRIGAQVTISHAVLGAQVVIYPGVRIGQDGFGFAITRTGFVPVPQLGRVLIGNGVEIGANTTIDRGSAQDTVIGDGVHIDNLVQLGHNVNIGRGSVIVAQAGVAGSTVVGEQVMLAAQSGLSGHLHIGNRARIGAQAGVMTDVPAGQDFLGSPAKPSKAYFREVVTLRKLATQGRQIVDRTPQDKPKKA
jgi:UDP-3-O-[3-hydroxymyristoyl] glucosamine N-acyltransferase